MAEAYIIDALRTPVGRRGKSLAEVHPLDLAAAPLAELVRRNNIDSEQYDEIILGCIDQVGPNSMDIARSAWLAAGLSEPFRVPPSSASAVRDSKPSPTPPRRS